MRTAKRTMIEAGKNLVEAQRFARRLSVQHPGKYVTLYACFGIFAQISDRLSVHAPSDSLGGSYFRNGSERRFTDAQIVADQNATPMMS